MNCEHCQKWIGDAALGTLKASRLAQFKAHIAECGGCRRTFESEQRLFAAIDQGIVARIQSEPSAQFAAGVQMRLAEQPERVRLHSWWRSAPWSPALALGALAVSLLAVWFVRQAEHAGISQQARVTNPASLMPQVKPVAPTQSAPILSTRVVRKPPRIAQQRPPGAEVGRPQFQVLVEPGQWGAIAAAYCAAQSGQVDAESLVDKIAQQEPPISLKPVEIAPVTVAELYPEKQPKTTER